MKLINLWKRSTHTSEAHFLFHIYAALQQNICNEANSGREPGSRGGGDSAGRRNCVKICSTGTEETREAGSSAPSPFRVPQSLFMIHINFHPIKNVRISLQPQIPNRSAFLVMRSFS